MPLQLTYTFGEILLQRWKKSENMIFPSHLSTKMYKTFSEEKIIFRAVIKKNMFLPHF